MSSVAAAPAGTIDGRRGSGKLKLKRVLAPLLNPADGEPSSDPSSRAPTKPTKRTSHRPLYNATVLRGNESALMHDCLAARPWWRETPEGEAFNLWWGGNGQGFDFASGFSDAATASSQPGTRVQRARQLVNKFAHNCQICVKARLAHNLRRYAREAKLDLGSLVPLTFVVTSGEPDDAEYCRFKGAAAALASERGESVWIVKPRNMNRGIGIEVCESSKAVDALLKKKKRGSQHVVQKYVERPLLVRGRKFDIRLYVLVTSDLKVFMYRDSYVRTCSTAYDAANCADKSMHLTNDYVQKFLDSYGTHEDANKLSFDELQAIFREEPLADGKVLSVADDLWPQMRRCVQATIACALPHFPIMAPGGSGGGGSFELYGLDFLVDADGKVFLLEVNTSPALFRHGKVLTEMLPRMIEEVFQKAVDPHFPAPEGAAPPPPLDRYEQVDVDRSGCGGPPPPTYGGAVYEKKEPKTTKTSLKVAIERAAGGGARAARMLREE